MHVALLTSYSMFLLPLPHFRPHLDVVIGVGATALRLLTQLHHVHRHRGKNGLHARCIRALRAATQGGKRQATGSASRWQVGMAGGLSGARVDCPSPYVLVLSAITSGGEVTHGAVQGTWESGQAVDLAGGARHGCFRRVAAPRAINHHLLQQSTNPPATVAAATPPPPPGCCTRVAHLDVAGRLQHGSHCLRTATGLLPGLRRARVKRGQVLARATR